MNLVLLVLDAVINTIWQAVLITALVWVVLRYSPRINAATRHAIWWATLLVVLILPSAPPTVSALKRRASTPTSFGRPAVTAAAPSPTDEPIILHIAPAPTAIWPRILVAIWAAIVLWRMQQIVRSYFYLRAVKRRARDSAWPLPSIGRHARLLVSRDIGSPMALGFLHPAIILPDAMVDQLSITEREHVLLHESAHLAGYDDWLNLALRILGGALALHPVAVWILRLIEREREIACDDWVVTKTGQARSYAESLAHLIELRHAQRGPVLASGFFGHGARISERVELLIRRRRFFSAEVSSRGLSLGSLFLCAVLVVSSAAPRWIAFAQVTQRPSFAVVSIKPNASGASGITFWPKTGGRLIVENNDLANLIGNAYGVGSLRLIGLPEWGGSDRFDIDARADGNPSKDELMLMLQTLLADRFKLRVHRETRDLHGYALTPAKGGIKVQAAKEGSCVENDSFHPRAETAEEKEQPHCGNNHVFQRGGRWQWVATRIDMHSAAGALGAMLRSPVVDRTEFTGKFDVQLDLPGEGMADNRADSVETSETSLFTLLQEKLGVKLDSIKVTTEVVVIDHVERPDAN